LHYLGAVRYDDDNEKVSLVPDKRQFFSDSRIAYLCRPDLFGAGMVFVARHSGCAQ
jgi:hypothetical protein